MYMCMYMYCSHPCRPTCAEKSNLVVAARLRVAVVAHEAVDVTRQLLVGVDVRIQLLASSPFTARRTDDVTVATAHSI